MIMHSSSFLSMGHFIAYYVSRCYLERQAADFHCARLNLPGRVDGYLLFIRFALSIFSLLSPQGIKQHPQASRLPRPLPLSSRSPPMIPLQAVSPSYAEEFDSHELMGNASAAKFITNWYKDVDREDLPADLAWAWREHLDYADNADPDLKQLRQEWEEKQRRVREEGLYPTNTDQNAARIDFSLHVSILGVGDSCRYDVELNRAGPHLVL
ncbi:hypothetical protein C8Q73DRAFT_779309 [Cubamyces lactineus]|nr:hypothetical protein C8Q73DRAFT_779309 [Cubamyces lactineus]